MGTGLQASLAALDPLSGALEQLYAPEVDLASGRVVAVDSGLRWSCPDVGVLPAVAWLPAAVRAGRLAELDAWALDAGAGEAVRWQALPGPTRELRVPVGADTLRAPGASGRLARWRAASGLPAGGLGLRLDPAALRLLGEQAAEVLAAVRDAGIALALPAADLAAPQLAGVPVDTVVLGPRLVRTAHDAPDAVRALVEQAHDRGAVVVATGLPTGEQAARLRELGCDRAQGWPVARPLSADRLRRLLAEGAPAAERATGAPPTAA